MIDWNAEVFAKVKNAVSSLCTNVSQTWQENPSELPFVCVNEIGLEAVDGDMDNNECAAISTIEITAYSREGLTDARNMVVLADAKMREMGFQRNLGPQQVIDENVTEQTAVRVMARYSRLIADGDEL